MRIGYAGECARHAWCGAVQGVRRWRGFGGLQQGALHEASVGRSSGRWGGGERASKGWLVNSRRAHTHEPGSWLCIWRGIVSTLHTNELHQDVSFSRWTDHASKWVCCAQRAGPLRTTCGIRRCCCERDCEALSLFSIIKKIEEERFCLFPFVSFMLAYLVWLGCLALGMCEVTQCTLPLSAKQATQRRAV